MLMYDLKNSRRFVTKLAKTVWEHQTQKTDILNFTFRTNLRRSVGCSSYTLILCLIIIFHLCIDNEVLSFRFPAY